MLEMTTPFDGPGEATAFRAFEEANVRPVTPAERRLLRDLANRFEATAVAAARHDSTIPGSGWGWLAAAIYEAVAAGSAFVAPRRLREILSRWERDGFPQLDDGRARTAAGTGGMRGEHEVNPPRESLGNSRPGVNARSSAGGQIPDPPGEAPNLMLPHGHGSRETWAFTVGLLETALERAVLTELVAGTAITGYREGEVTIRVPDRVRAERFATVYRELVTRKLSEAMRRPVRLAVLTPMTEAEDGAIAPTLVIQDGRSNSESATMTAEAEAESIAPSFVVAECGLPSGQVWAAVLGEVMTNGMVSRTNYDAWLRVTRLIGRGGAGEAGTSLVVGVANGLAERRVSGRFMPALRAAVFAVVGARLEIEVVVTDEWLAARTPGEALPLLAMRRATGG
jgi:hypothetical protein